VGDLAGDVVDLEIVDAPGAALAGEDVPSMLPFGRLESADRLGEIAYGIAEGLDRLGSIIRDLDRELFFEGHHQLDLVEGIGAEVVDEAGLVGHLLGIDIEVLHNDLADAVSDIAHSF
jgi:hypothetical protein